MGTDTNKHYQIPKYMKNFECIGKDCIDSCCVGWNIQIDKNTYKKYNLKHLFYAGLITEILKATTILS